MTAMRPNHLHSTPVQQTFNPHTKFLELKRLFFKHLNEDGRFPLCFSPISAIITIQHHQSTQAQDRMTFSTMIYGFGVSLSLILAIGAQNAFVLKQGLKKQFVFLVCAICAISDAILIAAGVFGLGTLINQNPMIVTVAKYFGAIFLFWYGFRNFKSSFQGGGELIANGQDTTSVKKIIALTLAFTWLNPHVYLDTVVLIGTISAKFSDKIAFSIGAMSASFLFFFSLGYGARILEPIFKKPKAWQILDFMIGVVMWGIALSLLFMK